MGYEWNPQIDELKQRQSYEAELTREEIRRQTDAIKSSENYRHSSGSTYYGDFLSGTGKAILLFCIIIPFMASFALINELYPYILSFIDSISKLFIK